MTDTTNVPEAPEGDASTAYARKIGSWVESYPKTVLDLFVENVLALSETATSQAALATQRASQATLEATKAVAARTRAEVAAVAAEEAAAGVAAQVALAQDAAEASGASADESAASAVIAAEEAEKSRQTIATHLADPDPHSAYLKKALPAEATAEDQYAWSLNGWVPVEATGPAAGGEFPVLIARDGYTLAADGYNVILVDDADEATFYLPNKVEGDAPCVVNITVDFGCPVNASKEIIPKIFLATKNGEKIRCPTGLGDKVYLPMIHDYKAYFFGNSWAGWRINDAELYTVALTGYEINWDFSHAISGGEIVDQYYGDGDKTLFLFDALLPSYNTAARPFGVSVDTPSVYSTYEDLGNGATADFTDRTISYNGTNWQIVKAWPVFWPYGTPYTEYIARNLGAGSTYARFRSYTTNLTAFVAPTFVEFTDEKLVSYYSGYVDGVPVMSMSADQTGGVFNINYLSGTVYDSNSNTWMKNFTFPTVTSRKWFTDLMMDRSLFHCFAALSTDNQTLVVGFTEDYPGAAANFTAGTAYERTIALPANANPNGWWKIVGFNASEGLVWFGRRSYNLDAEGDEVLYEYNFLTEAMREVTTRLDTDPITVGFERFVIPTSGQSFWLSRAQEPTGGWRMVYLQSGFPEGEYVNDPTNHPVAVFDPQDNEFDVLGFEYLPKRKLNGTDVAWDGYLAVKHSRGWKLSKLNVSELMFGTAD